MSVPNTFLQLLDEYMIEIPRVQRDYAQGRNDEHSTIVRTNLLSDIKDAYEGKKEPLDLNFIYGKTTVDKKFYPIDGQQRLTTLFLIHVFAFFDDESKTPLLLKFSYEARTTTREFFKALVSNRREVFVENALPETVIKDAAWFIDSWKYDPSVANAMNMLNDISKKGFNVYELKIQLEETANPKVFFQFIELNNLGKEDDLYIKLNARGRPLTSFESFKSRLVDQCAEAIPTMADEIKNNIDGLWSEMIWSIGKEHFDELFLRFFETLFLNCGLLKSEANTVVSKNWIYSLDYSLVSADIFVAIRNTLNYLASNPQPEAFDIIINTIKTPSQYPNKVLFHAVCRYLSDENNPSQVDTVAFSDWIRVFRNLVNNSRIEEADVYLHAIDSINVLLPEKNNILKYLASGKVSNLSGFLKEQFDEECQKARIMCKDSMHKKAILDSEKKLPYFGGQIRSILFISDYEKKDNLQDLNSCVEKEAALFSDRGPKNGVLLRKALCSIGDYRLHIGNYKTLCIDDPNENSRTPSLKRLFTLHGKEVQELLEYINLSNSIESQLLNLINSKKISQADWRYCFVNYADVLFPLMSTSHLRTCKNADEELLVPNKQSNGENYSIHLWTLQHILNESGLLAVYHTDKGFAGDRYLEVKNVKVRYKNKAFVVEDSTGCICNTTTTENVFDEIVPLMKKLP